MSIEVQLKEAIARRQQVVDAISDIAMKSGPMTKEDEEHANILHAEVGEWDAKITKFEQLTKMMAAQARPVEPEIGDQEVTPAVQPVTKAAATAPALSGARSKPNRPVSMNVAKAAWHMMRNNGVAEVAAVAADRSGDLGAAAILKAAVNPLVTTSGGDAAALIRDSWGEFYDLLRPMTVIGRLPGATRVDMTGVDILKLPYRSTGASGYWVGQAKPIPVSTNVFGSMSLAPYKVAVIVPSSRELFTRSTPAAEQLLRDDMLAACATTADTLFVSSTAASAGVSPAGIANGVAGSYTYASAGLSVANVTTDLSKARKVFAGANIKGQYAVVCDPTFVEFARALRDANSNFAFPEINDGRIYGMPIIDSTVVTDTELLVIATDDVIIGEDSSNSRIELDFSATLQMQDDPTDPIDVTDDGATSVSKLISLFQSDLAALKVVMGITWGKRTRTGLNCVVKVTGGTWAS